MTEVILILASTHLEAQQRCLTCAIGNTPSRKKIPPTFITFPKELHFKKIYTDVFSICLGLTCKKLYDLYKAFWQDEEPVFLQDTGRSYKLGVLLSIWASGG